MIKSAIHYPSSSIRSLNTMKRALLLWDKYRVIGPFKEFEPDHNGPIREAWSLIGSVLVPEKSDQQRARGDIVEFLRDRERLDQRFFHSRQPTEQEHRSPYEVYPQKLLGETWYELEKAGLTRDLLPNADRQMSAWGGLMVMAKLADACAGEVFARVTDQPVAYRAIASEAQRVNRQDTGRLDEADVVPVLLSMVDATSIPISNLLCFRADEKDPTLRHNLLKSCSEHINAIRKAGGHNQIREIQDQFDRDMQLDLNKLRDILHTNKVRFGTSTAVLTAATGLFGTFAAMTHGFIQIGTTLAAFTSAGIGIKQVADIFGVGLDLTQRQRDTMEKHPMAYMHALSRQSA